MSKTKNLHTVLDIFLSYDPEGGPMHATHDEIYLTGPHPDEMRPQDVKKVEGLGVTWDAEYDSWHMFS